MTAVGYNIRKTCERLAVHYTHYCIVVHFAEVVKNWCAVINHCCRYHTAKFYHLNAGFLSAHHFVRKQFASLVVANQWGNIKFTLKPFAEPFSFH